MRSQLQNQKKKVRLKLKKIMKTMNPTRKVECTNSQKTDHTVIRFYRIKIISFVHI